MKYIKKYIEYLKESSKRDFMEKIRKTLGDIKDVKMLNYKWGYEYKNGVDLEKITPKEEWNKILLLGEEFVDREKYKENDNKPFRILAIGKINLDLYLTIDYEVVDIHWSDVDVVKKYLSENRIYQNFLKDYKESISYEEYEKSKVIKKKIDEFESKVKESFNKIRKKLYSLIPKNSISEPTKKIITKNEDGMLITDGPMMITTLFSNDVDIYVPNFEDLEKLILKIFKLVDSVRFRSRRYTLRIKYNDLKAIVTITQGLSRNTTVRSFRSEIYVLAKTKTNSKESVKNLDFKLLQIDCKPVTINWEYNDDKYLKAEYKKTIPSFLELPLDLDVIESWQLNGNEEDCLKISEFIYSLFMKKIKSDKLKIRFYDLKIDHFALMENQIEQLKKYLRKEVNSPHEIRKNSVFSKK